MANPFFKFKQFTVFHDKCAMKVGTDGVLLGAWASIENAKNILDIGTGSGLIALMLSQRQPKAKIDAIDIDENAFIQATENVKNSPFNHQISCYHASLDEFQQENPTSRYDLIISNPPFFQDSLKSPNKQRTMARHTDSLPIRNLLEYSQKHLNQNGRLALIYPLNQKQNIIEIASSLGMHIARLTTVYPTPNTEAKRILIELSHSKKANPIYNQLTIEKERHRYTDEFIALAKDFYLKL